MRSNPVCALAGVFMSAARTSSTNAIFVLPPLTFFSRWLAFVASVFLDVFAAVFVPVPATLLQSRRCNGHHQAPVLHAFQPDQAPGEMLHLHRIAMHNQHFKAGVVVEVC